MKFGKGVSLIIVSILLMILGSISFAGVWVDNFDDGKADGWDEIAGEWEVDDVSVGDR